MNSQHIATASRLANIEAFHVMELAKQAAELERAEALDFDVMKTYVRMNPAFMKAVSDEAGQRGVPTYSFHLTPRHQRKS